MEGTASTDTPAEMDGYDSFEEWAAEAVRGANNWLVTVRNAEDEGFDKWSDFYTSEMSGGDQNTGIVSYAEGLTSLGMTKEVAKDTDGWWELQDEKYQEDLQQLLNWILPDTDEADADRPRYEIAEYSATPYLGSDLTDDFTDAVSFSTSALIEAIKADIDTTGGEINEEQIERALETNLNWFLNNTFETETGVAWAWVGSTDDDYDPTPINYFTYSAAIALGDLLAYRDEKVINNVVDGRVEEIEEALRGAKRFLADENWSDIESCWERANADKVMTTCYTVMALSYIKEYVDDVTLDDGTEEKISTGEKIARGIGSVAGEMEKGLDQIWQKTVDYNCPDMQNQYTDGTAPYLVLDTLTEYLRFLSDDIGAIPDLQRPDVSEYDRETVEAKRDDLGKIVLEKCWAGDREFPSKGFRHIGSKGNIEELPKSNPTVLYSTQVGIETFLLNILEGGLDTDTVVNDETVPSPGGDVDERAVTGGQRIQNQYNFNFTVDGARDESDGSIRGYLEEIRAELDELGRSGGEAEAGDETIDQLERLNERWDTEKDEMKQNLDEHTVKAYRLEATERINTTFKQRVDQNWKQFRTACLKETFDTCQTLFYEDDATTFKGELDDVLEVRSAELLKPWIVQFQSLRDLSPDEIEDPVARKQAILDSIEALLAITPEEMSDEELEKMLGHLG